MVDLNIIPTQGISPRDGEILVLKDVAASFTPYTPRNGSWMFFPRPDGWRSLDTTLGTERIVQLNRFLATSIDYAILDIDDFISVSASAAVRTVTLPTSVGENGRRHTIMKSDATANAVILATTGGQTINGVSTFTLFNQYDAVSVVSDGANWFVDDFNFPGKVFKLDADLVDRSTTAVTTEEDLNSVIVPANVLQVNERGLRISAWGTSAANNNIKTIRAKFGSATLITNNVNDRPNGEVWSVDAMVFRTASNVQRSRATMQAGAVEQSPTDGSHTETDTAAITIKITGQNNVASAGDITCRGLVVEVLG